MNKSNRTKFNVDKNTAKRMSDDGIVFDSILEKNFYQEVILPNVQSGIIVEYELQKKYILQNGFKRKKHTVRAITYVADFYVKLYNGKEFVLDTKGMPDSVAKIKRKLFWYNYPLIDYYWVAYSKIGYIIIRFKINYFNNTIVMFYLFHYKRYISTYT